ncbi:MAG: 50S ribosomal protein L3 [Pseudomonadota bacterium]
MSLGLIARKRGMTRIFTEDGASIPVSVLEVEPNRVTRVKNAESDGYHSVQVTTGSRHANRINKSEAGEYKKANVEAGRGLWEFRLEAEPEEGMAVGSELKADLFSAGQKVDVTGTTIGKGFAGTIKRHHFAGKDATHGNSINHRTPGSIGQCQTPGRVFKGKKMSGHLGNAQRTAQNLEVVRVDVERNLLLIKGAVPGAKGGDLLVKPAHKASAADGES